MKYFDLHSDTAYEIKKQEVSLSENDLHIDMKKLSYLQKYAQVMAIWSNEELTDEDSYIQFKEIADNLRKELKLNGYSLSTDFQNLEASLDTKGKAFMLGIEDARLLCGKIERLQEIYENNVRFLTLTWAGVTCVGGSHDTDAGLTDFGKEVVSSSFELGIIPDISHASKESADDALNIAEKYARPIVATHSNSFSVFSHRRNLRDEHFRRISALGGVVGVSLCSPHLSDEEKRQSDISDILRHIEHYLSVGGENSLCIGADLDGAPLPHGFSDVRDIEKIGTELNKRFGNEITEKIMWSNAFNFIKRNF